MVADKKIAAERLRLFALAVAVTLFVPARSAGQNAPSGSGAAKLPSGVPAASAPARQSATPRGAAATGQYTGPGSCSSSSCHGSVKPRDDSRVLQNEYSTWIIKDKHSRTYQALTGRVGERMAQLLKLGTKAEESPKCLACHALAPPVEKRARTFELADGVSCESCHGPAAGWLGPHTTRGWTHEQSLAAGMVDTRNLFHRTEKCLSCHLGNQEQFVDHEMLAAGHPDLYFELDSFSAVMPRHWNVPRQQSPGVAAEDGSWAGVREWGTGQAVELRAALERLAVRAKGKVWPEYSEMQCLACHHALGSAEESWRQERGYSGRRPGDPPWNASRYVVFRHLAKQADPPMAQELDRQLARVTEEMSKLNPDRDAVSASAAAAAPLAQKFAARFEAMPFDQAITLRLLGDIAGDAENIALQGERAAEQATMALDSLYIAYSRSAKPADAARVRTAINELFRQVENPSNYKPEEFARQMQAVGALLRP